jgi:toxin HigB-1
VIKSFADAATERLFNRERVKKFEAIQRIARRKLDAVNAARILGDLAAIPGNRLEQLHGDREGQHSIRINDQWRICFIWKDRDNDAYRVEITDYH